MTLFAKEIVEVWGKREHEMKRDIDLYILVFALIAEIISVRLKE